MSLQLYFVPSKLPRTISRKEWYEIWQWKRKTERALNKHLGEELLMLQRPDLPDHIKQDLIDKVVNPPILLGPYMDRK